MWQMRRRLPGPFELVAVFLLAATALDAVATSRGWHGDDFALFAAAGRTMLSGRWLHTFHDPKLQSAPLELLTATAFYRVAAGSRAVLAVATELACAGALIAAFRSIVGRKAVALAFFGVAALLLGVVPDAYTTGHFAEPAAGLLWLLAARDARAGRVRRAGILVGLSAGFELWGILGIAVLALAPSLRRSALGAAFAAATASLILGPFVLAGDFHMFAFHWHVSGGAIGLVTGVGYPFGWPLRLLQGCATVGLAAALARIVRSSPASIFVIPAVTTIVRLLLDPLGTFYYWDPVIELALLGAASAFVRREALRAWVEATLAPA